MRNLFVISQTQVECNNLSSHRHHDRDHGYRRQQQAERWEENGFGHGAHGCTPGDEDGDENGDGDRLAGFALNPENGLAYAATAAGIVYGIDPSNPGQILFELPLQAKEEDDTMSEPERPRDRIVSFEYLIEEEALLVAMEGGDLLLLHVEQKEIECVGMIDGGIAAVSWSPDGEVLVVATKWGKLLMMTKEWEVLAEVDMENSYTQEDEKIRADAKIDDNGGHLSQGMVTGCVARISWRGDGKYFATVSGDEGEGWSRERCVEGSTKGKKDAKCVRIWEREGCVLHACTEKTKELMWPVAWRPNGSLIAAVRKGDRCKEEPGRGGGGGGGVGGGRQDSVEVLLFERNGLQRGGFWLDRTLEEGYRCARVDELWWSMDSELLLIVVRGQEPSCDLVQIWCRMNYHWYMKLEWRFEREVGVHAFWDSERPARLHFWMSDGAFRHVDLGWDCAVERVKMGCPTAAVIDGRFLRITPLADSLMPPPMSVAVLAYDACVQCASVMPGSGLEDRTMVVAVLSDGSVGILSVDASGWQMGDGLGEEEWGGTILRPERVDLSGRKIHARHVAWLGPRRLLLTVPACDASMHGTMADIGDGVSTTRDGHGASSLQYVVPGHDGDLFVEVVLTEEDGDQMKGEEEEKSVRRKKWLGTVVRESWTSQRVTRIVRDDVLSPTGEVRDGGEGISGGTVIVALEDGRVERYVGGVGLKGKSGMETGSKGDEEGFPCNCPWIAGVKVGNSVNRRLRLVGLSEKGVLYLNKRVLVQDCVSFAVHFGGILDKGRQVIQAGKDEEDEEDELVSLVFTTRRDVMYVARVEDCVGRLDDDELAKNNKKVDVEGEVEFRGDCLSKFAEKVQGGDKSKWIQKVQGKDHQRDFSVRPIWERGARIIAALGGREVGVVLQTARGNLETVFPRGLILEEVGRAIRLNDYGRAMEMARRHRLDLNVLVDYGGWRNFVRRGVKGFLKGVDNLGHVSELVLALNSDDVTEGVYKGYITAWDGTVKDRSGVNEAKEEASVAGGNASKDQELDDVSEFCFGLGKVSSICKAIRGALLQRDQIDSRLDRAGVELCILTTLVRSDPPELEEALQRVKLLREWEFDEGMLENEGEEEEENAKKVDGRSKGLSTERALKHLMFLTDPDRLFNTALGSYDLHLAAMVASHSQRDPKEFLPFLQELEAMPSPIRRFTIDKKLNRMESALRNLAEAEPPRHEECLALVRTHTELFPVAMELFSGSAAQRNAVLEAWGDHMLSEEKYSDAALAYSTCRQWLKATRAYRAGGQWRGVMSLAGKTGLSRDEVKLLASELREELRVLRRPVDAARVAIDYLDDLEGATGLLIDAREWIEALRIGYLCKERREIGRDAGTVETRVTPAAVEAARMQIYDLDEEAERVEKYLRRWREVRERRLQLAARLKNERDCWEGVGAGIDEDAESVADSVGSDLSAYDSGMSSSSASERTPSRSGGSIVSGSGSGLHKRASRRAAKRAAKGHGGPKIRAGSPGEELALLEYVNKLAISPRVQEEIGQLSEVLILLEKEGLARQLQQRVGDFMDIHQRAVKEMVVSQAQESADLLLGKGSNGHDEPGSCRSESGKHDIQKSDGGPVTARGPSTCHEGRDDVRWSWKVLEADGGSRGSGD